LLTSGLPLVQARISRYIALLNFDTLTGCDHTSAFRGKGKNSAWPAWQAYEEITGTFRFLATHPFEHSDFNFEHFQIIE